jgi:hypothetical protein
MISFINRIEMGVSELKNNPLLAFQPIFYKGTSFANYEEARHVLSLNNCVLMDDLFQNQSTKPSSEATCAKNLDKEIGDDSIVENDDDLLHFEGGTTDEFMSPNKISNDLSRYQNNIMAYVSPATKRLHNDILRTSPSRVRHHNAESLRASRKNMIDIIDYIIKIGEIEEDPQSAIMFDDMEKTLQKYKLELQRRKLSQPKTPPRKGMIEFAAFNGPKKKPEPRLKGVGG